MTPAAIVLVSDRIDHSALDLLRHRGFEIHSVSASDGDKLREAAATANGWIVRSGTTITADLIDAAPELKVIGRAGVGVDNIDVEAATRKGIAVLNTPAGNTMAAVEHSIALLLSLSRNVPAAHASLYNDGSWERKSFTGVELYQKSIGVLGLGKIGGRVAARCLGLEMKVLGYDPFLSAERAAAMGVELIEDLDELLPRCDFISLHLPATEKTIGLINADRLDLCKPGVRIVNCARGSLVVESALAEALQDGRVAGAALDVFENEPPTESPILKAPNVVVTPHLGASTVESQKKVGLQIAEQVADALDKGVFREAVNIPVHDWHTFEKIKPGLKLVERLGQFAQQYVTGGVTRVEAVYCGPGFEELEAINSTLLKGLLSPVIGEAVNAVNAPLLAEERGIRLEASQDERHPGHYQSLVRLRVTLADRQHTLAGTLFTDDEPRLVELDGFEVELFLFGVLLVFANYDRPGVIGDVGTLLGNHSINVAHFSLGRQKIGGEALGVVAVDEAINDEVIAELSALPNMRWVTQVQIDN